MGASAGQLLMSWQLQTSVSSSDLLILVLDCAIVNSAARGKLKSDVFTASNPD